MATWHPWIVKNPKNGQFCDFYMFWPISDEKLEKKNFTQNWSIWHPWRVKNTKNGQFCHFYMFWTGFYQKLKKWNFMQFWPIRMVSSPRIWKSVKFVETVYGVCDTSWLIHAKQLSKTFIKSQKREVHKFSFNDLDLWIVAVFRSHDWLRSDIHPSKKHWNGTTVLPLASKSTQIDECANTCLERGLWQVKTLISISCA